MWWHAILIAMISLSNVAVASAQITYSVFPAVPQTMSPAAQQPVEHGSVRVTLVVRDSTIGYVVKALAQQAHFQAVFEHSALLAKRVDVKLVDIPALDAFAIVLKGTGLAARVAPDGETLVIRTQESVARPVFSGTIAGRITDSASGAGLGGASVKVAGMRLSAVTSDSGRFTLKEVPPGDQVLMVRLFGYKSVERTVTVVDSGQTTVRIALVPVPTVLSGVVTTATGLQKKIEVGNDITTINVDSVMKVAPIMSVTDLLENRVPGLTVLHTSGAPGDPSRLRLRGASNINGNNDPIIIVDGIRVYASQSDPRNDNLAPSTMGKAGANRVKVSDSGKNQAGQGSGYAAPSPIDQIDPNTIETIEVFKGPSAAALYGSDAANGVVVITTKHGRAGPTHWNVALGTGRNTEPGNWPVNYYRFGYGSSSAPGSPFCLWDDVTCGVDSVVAFQALNDPRYSVFADHGSDQTASLTVSGGQQTLTYSLTATGTGQVGLLKLPGIEDTRFKKFYGGPPPGWMQRPQQYTTWGVSGQLSAQPSANVRVTLSSSLLTSNQQNSSLETAISQLQGEYIDGSQLASTPLVQQFVERATAGQVTATNALTLFWAPRPWLPITVAGGINTMQKTDGTYIPFGISADSNSYGGSDTTGSYGLGRGSSQNNTINVGTTIPALHNRLQIGLGGNFTSQSTADVRAFTNQLAPGVTAPSIFPTSLVNQVGVVPSTFGQTTSAGSTYGWFFEPRFNISQRFFIAPGFRLDGGSASGSHVSTTAGGVSIPGVTGFPKIDLSYLAIDQNRPRGPLTLLRPRLAFGRAGTQPDPTARLRLFATDSSLTTLNGQTLVPSVQLSSLGNTKLTPEIVYELEGGFDVELWRGRLTLGWTQYNKTTHNEILQIPVAPSVVGVESFFTNIGEVRNTGHEMTAQARLLDNRAFSWTVGGYISNDNNVVVSLNKGQSTIDLGDGTRVEVGFPIFARFARPIASFADANHDGIIEFNEIRYGDSAVYVGQQIPKYTLNFNTGVTLLNGRLSINANFAYQNGLTQFNDGALQSGAFALLPNTPGTPLATQAAVVAATDASGGFAGGQEISNLRGFQNTQTIIGLIQTVSTFRFSSLSINYAVPAALSRMLLRVPTMSIALQGENLGLYSNYRGKDPNVNVFSTVSAGDETLDLGQIPQPRTFWLKLNLGL